MRCGAPAGMPTIMCEHTSPTAEDVTVTSDTLCVELNDGRTIIVPPAWFPRLFQATAAERKNWRLVGRDQGIHWNDLDEDIFVEGLLAGRGSAEGQTSFNSWLVARAARKNRRIASARRSERRAEK